MADVWKTVRVFISSTFVDMHRERDHLVRVVFPELKERCRTRHVHLVDVDLRWGVTQADAEGGRALDICLDEIDGCRPYFIGILGHRYGFVPDGQRHSITAQEIYHGVLHAGVPKQVMELRRLLEEPLEGLALSSEQKDCLARCYRWDADKRKYLLEEHVAPQDATTIRSVFDRFSRYQKDRSFFFFRSESLSRQLAGEATSDYFEGDPEDRNRLESLKQDVIEAGLPHFHYADIEAFGQLVLERLWERIEAEAAQVVAEVQDWLEQEDGFHALFMADHSRHFVGRRELLDRMHGFCSGDEHPSVLVITGTPGCGKSALLARFADEASRRHPAWLILGHFVGASPSSTGLRHMLRRLCRHLNRATGAHEGAPEDIKDLLKLFPELLTQASRQQPLLIVIDAVNQLERVDRPHSMHWIPQILPKNVRLVISTQAGEARDAMLQREITPLEETIDGLTSPEIMELVETYLRAIRHEFPNRELERHFYQKVEHGNPLYILVALEELRLFGSYENLGDRINRLPGDVPALFDQVLERIESDFNAVLIRECMSYLACGRHGLTAEELQTLLKAHAPRLDSDAAPVKLPDMLWSRLYRSFSAYLFERSGVIDFFHGQLKEAVGKRYLRETTSRDAAHQAIAGYLARRWTEPYARALDELPHQQMKARMWPALVRTLGDLQFIESKCGAAMTHDLIADFESALLAEELPAESRSALEEFAHFVHAHSHVLARNPALTFQQAANEPDSTAPARAARARMDAGLEVRPWFQHVNKPQSHSACLMTIAGHTEWVIACVFSPDGSRIVSLSSENILKSWDARTGAELDSHSSHPMPVSKCAFSHDGSRMVLAPYYGPMQLWNAQTGSELAIFSGGRKEVNSCAFSPDGSRVVSASEGEPLKLWDATTGAELATFRGYTAYVNACAFSPDGGRIVSATRDRYLKLWDAATGASLAVLWGHRRSVTACTFSPDGNRILSASKDKTLRLWDAVTGDELAILAGHRKEVISCAFSPDGGRILSVSADGILKLWDAQAGTELATLEGHTGSVYACAFSPDGSRVVSASSDDTLVLWDVATGTKLATLAGHTGSVFACAFSPDGSRVLSASADKTLKIWDAMTGTERTAVRHQRGSRGSCAYSPDGSRILSSSADHTLTLWDATTGAELAILAGHRSVVNSCAFSPDGSRIVSASEDKTLKLWDAATGAELATLTDHRRQVYACAFSPDGSRIVSGARDNKLKLWDAVTGAALATLAGHTNSVEGCAFSPDGSRIVSACRDTTLKLWDALRGVELATLAGHTHEVLACAFSPNGRRIVSASMDHSLKLWDAATGAELANLAGHTGYVSACSFSPDGGRIASASADDTMKLWDAATGAELATLAGHTGYVKACAFSPDGSRIVSASVDHTLKLWDAKTGAQICEYEFEGGGNAAAWSITGGDLAASDSLGHLLILRLRNLSPGPVLVTPWRPHPLWPASPEACLHFGCPLCRVWSGVSASALGTLLPCPHCGGNVKLNPFSIDADWRPVAAAWTAVPKVTSPPPFG